MKSVPMETSCPCLPCKYNANPLQRETTMSAKMQDFTKLIKVTLENCSSHMQGQQKQKKSLVESNQLKLRKGMVESSGGKVALYSSFVFSKNWSSFVHSFIHSFKYSTDIYCTGSGLSTSNTADQYCVENTIL